MTTYESSEVEGTDVEPRTGRACEEPMVVVPMGVSTGMFEVWTGGCDEEDDQPYVVDLAGEHDRCTCPDMEFNLENGERCKHARRCRLEFSLLPYEDVANVRSEYSAPMDVEFARRRRGIDVDPDPVEPEPELEPITVDSIEAKPEHAVQLTTDGGLVLEDPDAKESEDGTQASERDVRLEANRIATEAVANADSLLADFEVFCLTVEATQDTLLRLED